MKKLALSTAVAALLSTNIAFADDDHDDRKMMVYHVTITNTTVNHVLTPPLIVAHKKGFHLFSVGNSEHPASDGLATLAETGNPGPLAEELSDNPKVYSVTVGPEQAGSVEAALIFGGTPSITYEIHAPKGTMFSVASMLATTNDAFTSVTMKSPKRGRHAHAMGMTYDAGSEMNNEDCAFIPGPPCGGSNDQEDSAAPGEGFVTVHAGISGKNDLSAANLDWRGPTSMVSIHNAGRVRY